MSDPERLPNLGPTSARWLCEAGIDSLDSLRSAGAVGAYLAVRAGGLKPSLNLLWALEGALTNTDWQELPANRREELRSQVARN